MVLILEFITFYLQAGATSREKPGDTVHSIESRISLTNSAQTQITRNDVQDREENHQTERYYYSFE